MTYTVERTLPFSPFVIWAVLSDLTHFARNDPYHHNLRFISDKREGVGTQFKVSHRYWPIFPLCPDEVIFEVEIWDPKRILRARETNRKKYRTHTQEFLLVEEDGKTDCTTVQYNLYSAHIPLFPLLPLRIWAECMVTRRMNQKLAELENDCAKWKKEYDAHHSILEE
jgi:hypothetical protein